MQTILCVFGFGWFFEYNKRDIRKVSGGVLANGCTRSDEDSDIIPML